MLEIFYQEEYLRKWLESRKSDLCTYIIHGKLKHDIANYRKGDSVTFAIEASKERIKGDVEKAESYLYDIVPSSKIWIGTQSEDGTIQLEQYYGGGQMDGYVFIAPNEQIARASFESYLRSLDDPPTGL